LRRLPSGSNCTGYWHDRDCPYSTNQIGETGYVSNKEDETGLIDVVVFPNTRRDLRKPYLPARSWPFRQITKQGPKAISISIVMERALKLGVADWISSLKLGFSINGLQNDIGSKLCSAEANKNILVTESVRCGTLRYRVKRVSSAT